MSAVADLPRWDMSVVFPGLESKEFESAFNQFKQATDQTKRLFDAKNVHKLDVAPHSSQIQESFEEVIAVFNSLLEMSRTIGCFVSSFVTTDSRNELAQAKMSQLQNEHATIGKLATRLTAWIGSLDLESLLAVSDVAKSHAFALTKALQQSKHLMSGAEEMLATDLAITGSSAWGKLHGNFTSQMEITLEIKGQAERLPMSSLRNLAYDPDEQVRKTAYEAEMAAWQQGGTVLAACMNGIKGEVITLSKRRGWPSPLDEAIFNANIDRQTLDAMIEAAHESFPHFRSYLQAKAYVVQGKSEPLAWWNMFAPIAKESRLWQYEEGKRFILENFYNFSDRMGALAERAFKENWIDAEPRPGKRDGAFCASLRADESRILMNFKPSFSSVSTLAHELGHAYHGVCLADRTPLQRTTPMTLAETASIFCETIIRNAGLKQAEGAEKLAILEASIMGACQIVVDITSRFLFEKSLFERRADRELSAREMCDLLYDAQQQTYGNGLQESTYHTYMWAMKPHYYSTRGFYNFPYMYGQLFALGLYASYQNDPTEFKKQYDDLLSSTGLADAPTLADRFGINVRDKAFWLSSLSVIKDEIDQFVRLVK